MAKVAVSENTCISCEWRAPGPSHPHALPTDTGHSFIAGYLHNAPCARFLGLSTFAVRETLGPVGGAYNLSPMTVVQWR